jgi:hypothetical protein
VIIGKSSNFTVITGEKFPIFLLENHWINGAHIATDPASAAHCDALQPYLAMAAMVQRRVFYDAATEPVLGMQIRLGLTNGS